METATATSPTDLDKLAAAFAGLRTVEDVAFLLNVNFRKHLVFYLYRIHESKRYFEFQISKRNGSTRQISAPASSLKLIQQRLNLILQAVFRPKPSVHGFLPHRGIVTNAEGHVRKKFVLNIDLQDFFGSINFGRVRGMFMAKPYSLPAHVATVLAQICCHQNKLPQGAPTSPIISNMICSRLDAQLQKLAASHNCHYSRYADDITLSTNRTPFPREIAHVDVPSETRTVRVGDALQDLVQANGFAINAGKTRLTRRSDRHEVTGLVVNHFVNVDRRYVRNLRALLHAWRKYGSEALQQRYESSYASKARFPEKAMPSVIEVAYGRIQHVGAIRGWDDPVYMRLRAFFNELSPRKIRVPVDSWISTLDRACWVLEDHDSDRQGTAFFLKGYGLISCDHAIGADPYIYRPLDPSKKCRVWAKRRNSDIDLAILEPIDALSENAHLPPQAFASSVEYGDRITLAGYPDHAPGKELSIKRGEVQSFTRKSGIRRFNISTPIIFGNSGGPVLNRANRVIGVAVTGSDSLLHAATTEEHGVIPINALEYLLPASGP